MQYRTLFVGLTTVDIQYFVDEFPTINQKVKTAPPDIYVGGPASNAAVAFSHLNGGAHLATLVGKNPFSSLVESDFQLHNIHLIDACKSQNTNPVVASVITSRGGERNIFTNNPEEPDIDINIETIFADVKPHMVMLDGFYPNMALACAKQAKERSIPVVADCGSWKPQYTELLKYTNIAICSADFFPPDCKNMEEVIQFTKNIGVNRTAISRGENSIVFENNNSLKELPVKQVNAIDTLGAGDFLHGAFCYYFLKYNNFEKALKEAAEIASYSCTHKGTRVWLEFWRQS